VVTDALLVALDVDTVDHARALADQLRGVVGGFKIGSRLFTSHGPSFVEHLVSRGDRVFLDLKFHDIPHTVAGAVAAATRLGVWMVNVHASGGRAMLQAAREAADAEAARLLRPAPLVIAVTILTSLSERMLAEIGIDAPMTAQVERLAALAQSAGLDGVVASPQEISLIRARCGAQFTIVTPGIRPGSPELSVRGAGAPGVEVRGAEAPGVKDDQQRTLTAAQAMSAGASYLVVGRPIIAAPDPRLAAERIAADCRAASAP
jgi:orotidine-5'-phosphate decarboxylase